MAAMICGSFRMGGNVSDSAENRGRTITVHPERFRSGDAGKHQNSGHAAFQAGDDIGIHAVADHDGIGGMAVQHPQTGAHHQGIWLAAEICLYTCGNFNR